MGNKVGGVLFLKREGAQLKAKGEFTYNLGKLKREPVIGADGFHGYTEKPQIAKLSGEITDDDTISLEDILSITEEDITIELNNGKTIIFRQSFYMADGDVGTDEGNIQFEIGAKDAEEIPA